MKLTDELPQDVLEAVRAGRTIVAIKRLREHRELGLKEAKSIIDAYARKYPPLVTEQPLREEGTGGRLIIMVVLAVAGWLVYRYMN